MTEAGGGPDARSLRRYSLAIAATGLVHRLALLGWSRGRLETLVHNGYDSLLFHYGNADALREQLGASLFYLQQTPPIPALIVGLALKAADTWTGVTLILLLIEAVLSTSCAVVMFRLLALFGSHLRLYCAWSLVFLLSVDLVLIEYFAMGQTFYEVLSMTILTLGAYAFARTWREGGSLWPGMLGAAIAVAALSRATFSWFFPVPMLLLALRRPLPVRSMAVFAVVALPLQLAWAVKNAALYGDFDLGTSSWGGINVATSMERAGHGDAFRDYILDHPDEHPDWFVAMTRELGLVGWWSPYESWVPEPVLERDREIRSAFPAQSELNELRQRKISALYLRAIRRFALAHPDVVLAKLRSSYVVFWQPIRNQTRLVVDLFYVKPVIDNSFRVDGIVRGFWRGDLPEEVLLQMASVRTPADPRAALVGLATLPLLALVANVLSLNVLLPAVFLGAMWRRFPASLRWELWLFPAAAFAYAAALVNLAEFAENMRYRLAVEPMAWILTAQCVETAGRTLRHVTRG